MKECMPEYAMIQPLTNPANAPDIILAIMAMAGIGRLKRDINITHMQPESASSAPPVIVNAAQHKRHHDTNS